MKKMTEIIKEMEKNLHLDTIEFVSRNDVLVGEGERYIRYAIGNGLCIFVSIDSKEFCVEGIFDRNLEGDTHDLDYSLFNDDELDIGEYKGYTLISRKDKQTLYGENVWIFNKDYMGSSDNEPSGKALIDSII